MIHIYTAIDLKFMKYLERNTIKGEIKRAYIYDQLIFWDIDVPYSPFNLKTIAVYCDCKFFFSNNDQTSFSKFFESFGQI